MKYFIFILLIVFFIIFPEDIKAEFTKEVCIECCNNLPSKKSDCTLACYLKFSEVVDFNSRNECNYHCKKGLLGCRQMCFDDCAARFEYTPPNAKPPTRKIKKRREVREMLESLGLPVHRTTTRDPRITRIYKRYTNKSRAKSKTPAGASGSST